MYYCTLFDSKYLSRGLALYESLLDVIASDFELIVFAFDDRCYDFLVAQKFAKMKVVSLSEFEDEELLRIKPTRTLQEYCWTCTPSIISYSIKNFNLPSCTYLDADTYFFADPEILIEEAGQSSAMITEHRYAIEYENSEFSGKYCVQFMYFRNDSDGMQILEDWRKECLDWCYARFEDGKFGDQKYLDSWTQRYSSVSELQNIGGGVAPWNLKNYDIYFENSKLMIRDIKNLRTQEVVFFHFHDFRFRQNGEWYFGGNYEISDFALSAIYKEYLKKLNHFSEKFSETRLYTDYPGPFQTLLRVYFESVILSRVEIPDRDFLRAAYSINGDLVCLKDSIDEVEKYKLTKLLIKSSCYLFNSDIRFIQEYNKANYYRENLSNRESRTDKAVLLDIFLNYPILRLIPLFLKHKNNKIINVTNE